MNDSKSGVETVASKPTGFRWRLGLLTLVAGIAGTVVLSLMAPDDTSRMIWIFKSSGATLTAVLIWWLAFSGLSWQTRRNLAIGGLVCFVGLWFATIRKVSFDGDMRPRIQFRWSPPAANEVAQEWLAKNAPAASSAPSAENPESPSDSAASSKEPLEITDADWATYCGLHGDRVILEPHVRSIGRIDLRASFGVIRLVMHGHHSSRWANAYGLRNNVAPKNASSATTHCPAKNSGGTKMKPDTNLPREPSDLARRRRSLRPPSLHLARQAF